MVAGSTYRLNNFYGSKSKTVYRVAEPDVTIAFSWNFVLSVLENSSVPFPEDRFRFYGYEEFEAACDLRGDLYGLGLLVSDSLVLDEVEIASSRRILVHVQTHDGPVMKLYIWDKAAADFCEKFKALGKPPTVLLVRTVNPKHFGGALSMSSLSSSRVFFDMDVQATREYLAWYVFESNTDVANRVNAEIVTKAETATIGELFSYMKQEGAKANESVEDDHVVPVPQSLTDTIGQTRTFIIKEDVDEEPADERDGAADGTVKRSSDGIESGETKRAKCG
ncbi:hypothetical protein Bca52824_075000 [Brassica carinata]|uniref:Uncharacterized protein n=1 Tax=Brassica carinata TaxID=52824 RepID=A0A8X7TW42_BRACI|nr:hypothetical protein Bca52824_075000 [Brassica carinata]